MLFCALSRCLLVLSYLFLYVQNEPIPPRMTRFLPDTFDVNGISFKDAFLKSPKVKDIQHFRLVTNKLKVTADLGLNPGDAVKYSLTALHHHQYDEPIQFNDEWKNYDYDYNYRCTQSKKIDFGKINQEIRQNPNKYADSDGSNIQYPFTDDAMSFIPLTCSEREFDLRELFEIQNIFLIAFKVTDYYTLANFILVFKVFQFVYILDPVLLNNVFSPSKDIIKSFRVDDKELSLGSELLTENGNQIVLYYKNKADFKFDLAFQNGAKNFQCTGIISEDPLPYGEEDYTWNVYRPNVPYYLAFHTSADLMSQSRSPLHDSFNVKFVKYKSELKDERFLFHLVCANGFNITLESYTLDLDKVGPSLLPNPIPKDDSLPFYRVIKRTIVNSYYAFKRYIYVPNTNPSLPRTIETTELTHFPPISLKSPNSDTPFLKGYVKPQSSFIKELFILGNQVSLNKLGSNLVKPLEFDWNLNQPESLFKLVFNAPSFYLIQIQAVIWAKNGNDFRNPFSFYFKDWTMKPSSAESENLFFEHSLYEKDQFEKWKLFEDADRLKIQYRFFVSDTIHYTFFDIYFNPKQSGFLENHSNTAELEQEPLEVGKMQSAFSENKIYDLVLEGSVLYFEDLRIQGLSLQNLQMLLIETDTEFILRGYYSETENRNMYPFFSLSQELVKAKYVDALDNLVVKVEIPKKKELNDAEEEAAHYSIPVRIHVPSYVYQLPLDSIDESDEIIDKFHLGLIRIPVLNRQISGFIKIIYKLSSGFFKEGVDTSIPANKFVSSYFLQVKKSFQTHFTQAIRSASRVDFYFKKDAGEFDQYMDMVVHAFLLSTTAPIIEYEYGTETYKDDFLFHLYSVCDLTADNPKFLSLYVRAMNSPRFQFLYPNRVYSEIEINRAKVLSNMMTLCNYRKRLRNALNA